MKETYEELNLEIIRFVNADVLTTSPGNETPDQPFPGQG